MLLDPISNAKPCAGEDGMLQVSPFILEQDVTNLPEEFLPTAKWKSHMVSQRR
jgi:hypothetical protein